VVVRQCKPARKRRHENGVGRASFDRGVAVHQSLRQSGQDYYANGITENLTTELSRIKGSFVIARNTAFTYKGKPVDAKEIGKELGVRYVLEGSVQRDQNRVRVNAQLIDAESGAHLWADRFDENLADLFKLQDQVVARLANVLDFELTKAEVAKGAQRRRRCYAQNAPSAPPRTAWQAF
jgi:TolB-like protein